MKQCDAWKQQQQKWAGEYGRSYDSSGYVYQLNDNLFQPLSPEAEADFRAGSGGELERKVCALHSSAALVCNVFDYWRARSLACLGAALGTGGTIEGMRFEAQFPTGLPGNPPNLDVALRLESGQVWAIESKFTEPFGKKASGSFKSKYFPGGCGIWRSYGLSQSAELAEAIQDGRERFLRLDAPQLLKHALGLQVNHPGCFTLCYLYADGDGEEAAAHRAEIRRFGAGIEGDFPFVAMAYQSLFERLRVPGAGGDAAYFEYLEQRYSFMRRAKAAAVEYPMRLNVTEAVAHGLIESIPHQACRQGARRHWKVVDGAATETSVYWLFCWAKTGQGSRQAEAEARCVFDAIMPICFEQYDGLVRHDHARAHRYDR